MMLCIHFDVIQDLIDHFPVLNGFKVVIVKTRPGGSLLFLIVELYLNKIISGKYNPIYIVIMICLF